MLLLLRGPALASAGWTNAVVLALRDRVLTQADLAPGTYSLYADLNEAPATGRAMEGLGRAVALDTCGDGSQADV